ncbi:hypothetical protein V2T44_24020 [Serratia ficaria]|uniref:hypothetical protein n=1 Tax=Serratia ficaria TaxID=61651 RepID=UPI002ED353B1|nr:hypothetical protein [Serratia ficaria]
MKRVIVELWKNGELPIKNALYFADGRAELIDIISYPNPKLLKLGSFDFHGFYERNKDEITTIDIIKKIQLSDGGYLCIGEGSYGSEGFIACLDRKEDLIWVVYSENSNPFVSATIFGDSTVVIESSAGFRLEIDTENPEGMVVI